MANSYLSSNTGTATNAKKFTYSVWLKRSKISSEQRFYQGYKDGNNRAYAVFLSSDKLRVYNMTASNIELYWDSTRVFRDTSAWYHIVLSADSTQAAQADRFKVYVNGVEETDFTKNYNPGQNIDWGNQLAQTNGDLTISGTESQTQLFEGYMSHAAFVDGTALTPTSFGETDSTSGIWKFKSPSGVTWGTNGFHLKFENSAALGTDSSGQSNTFAVNGNLKQALDTPSNNAATINPNSTGNFKQSSNPNLASNGNTTLLENGGQHKQAPTTLAVDTGKWYCELKATSGTHGFFGACSTSLSAKLGNNYSYPGNSTTGSGVSIRRDNGTKSIGGSESTYGGSAISNGDIVGIALDLTNQKIYFSKNGQWSNGSSWSSSTFDAAVGAISLPSGAGTSFEAFYQFSFSPYNSGCDINFGNGFFGTTAITSAGSNGNGSLFEYDVPSGFYALNTKNINTYG